MTPLEVVRRYPAHGYSLYGALASRAQRIPQHSFLEFENQRISYAEACALVHQAMALLASRGVKPGARIAVMAHNHPATAVLFIALASLGAMMVGVNPEFGEKEAHYVLDHSQSSGIVCSLAALATVEAVSGSLPARPWIMTNEPDFLSGAVHQAPAPVGRADDVCILVYTSGTTGFPKGVMHSQRSVLLAGEGFVRRMHLDPAERILCLLPMFHVNAMFYSLAGAIAAGATLLLEEQVLGVEVLADRGHAQGDRSEHHRGDDEHPDAPAARGVRAGPHAAQDLRRAVLARNLSRVRRGVRRAASHRGLRHVGDPRRAAAIRSTASGARAAWASRACIPIRR